MKKSLMDKLIDKIPVSDEIKAVIGENVDVTKDFTKAMISQALSQGDRIKDEIKEAATAEIISQIKKIEPAELLKNVLDDMEITVTLSFKKKKDKDA